MVLLEIIIILSPIPLEIIYDKKRWRRGLPDKPSSTWLRAAYFVAIALVFEFAGISSWWQTLIILFFTHLMFFDAALNKFRKPPKPLSYHSDVGIDRFWGGIPFIAELFLKGTLWYSAMMFYWHLDWIVKGVPEWFRGSIF